MNGLMWAGLLLAVATGSAVAAERPEVVHVGVVAPDIIGVTVHTGHVEYGEQVPYEKQPGDDLIVQGHQRWITREGESIGSLVGGEGTIRYTFDTVVQVKLDTTAADSPATWIVSSADDPAYADGVLPTEVDRKSKPTDLGRTGAWEFEGPQEHVVYLRMPTPLTEGSRYTIGSADLLPDLELVYDPRQLRSEAVHVGQVGFRPDDPAKVAFLSCWTGSGGGLAYPDGLMFEVLDEDGNAVFTGPVRLSKAAADETEDAYNRNYTLADVHEMDFTSVTEPGVYRVCVEGIGCSYPFPIGDDAWRNAFYVSARGFYHQRSGIELGPPYTEFRRPPTFHPDDGVVVYHSDCPLMDSGNGLNAKGTDEGNFANLVKGKTDQVVEDAWGGYMDAGDWDRRVQHLIASRYLIELAELFPDYYGGLDLNLPESGNELPDVMDEALFNLDHYRRMQTPDGGIRGGVESEEHPRHGEASWQESLTILAYAPGVWSSHVYAGVAAQAAGFLESRDAGPAAAYRESALRAMEWAEANFAAGEDYPHAVNDARNLAAAELFRLTGEPRWNELFLETTVFKDPAADPFVWQKHEQREAAWVYARTDRPGTDEEVQANCRAAIMREAENRAASVERTGFRYAKYEWQPPSWGAFAAPDGVSLVRAHLLTGEEKYLRAAVLACQMGVGANPSNVCYTSGVGANPVVHPLHIDSRITGQPAPPGLTVGGPMDPQTNPDYWGHKLANPFFHPPIVEWPAVESYYDVFWSPVVCEFTVQNPMARNAYVWGYLAARP